MFRQRVCRQSLASLLKESIPPPQKKRGLFPFPQFFLLSIIQNLSFSVVHLSVPISSILSLSNLNLTLLNSPISSTLYCHIVPAAKFGWSVTILTVPTVTPLWNCEAVQRHTPVSQVNLAHPSISALVCFNGYIEFNTRVVSQLHCERGPERSRDYTIFLVNPRLSLSCFISSFTMEERWCKYSRSQSADYVAVVPVSHSQAPKSFAVLYHLMWALYEWMNGWMDEWIDKF